MLRLVDGAPPSLPLSGSAPELPDPPGPKPSPSLDFERLLRGVGQAIDRGEALVGRADRAAYAPMDAGTLIALQAGIYRYTEAIDLTAKVVDRATSAARTVLQGGH